jgi:hypothetical protein
MLVNQNLKEITPKFSACLIVFIFEKLLTSVNKFSFFPKEMSEVSYFDPFLRIANEHQ